MRDRKVEPKRDSIFERTNQNICACVRQTEIEGDTLSGEIHISFVEWLGL